MKPAEGEASPIVVHTSYAVPTDLGFRFVLARQKRSGQFVATEETTVTGTLANECSAESTKQATYSFGTDDIPSEIERRLDVV